MPVYEFFCKKCNAIDEVVRSMKDASLPYDCPECGQVTARRYTAPTIHTDGEQIPVLNPAFGAVMTPRQAEAEARRRGWVPVGNDKQTSISPPRSAPYDV